MERRDGYLVREVRVDDGVADPDVAALAGREGNVASRGCLYYQVVVN